MAKLFAATRIRTYAWLSLASQIALVVTGGVVRLTGSGLGCPTWPKCTPESLVTVPEMGFHGVIEFGNRMLTFALVIIAVLTLIAVFRNAEGKELRLRGVAIFLFLGIPAQAIVGGISVLTKLNPWVVGSHFVLSGVLIALASVLVFRAKGWEPSTSANRVLASLIAVVGTIAVLIGVAVTGAGPHSGDAATPRNGLDLEVWQHYHSYPGYLLLLLSAIAAWQLWRSGGRTAKPAKTIALLLVANIVFQAVIGVLQSRWGVPPLLVALHMFGAATAISLITLQFLASGKRA